MRRATCEDVLRSAFSEVAAFDITVDALAVSRLVRLVQVDEIPVGALRERLLERHGDKTWAALLSCPWCLSIHAAAGVAVARHLFPRAWPILARVLAASEVTGHLAHLAER